MYTVLSPYFTVYVSLIDYQIRRLRGMKKRSFISTIGIVVSILPTMLILLIAVENLYMILSVIVYPFILLLSWTKKGEIMLQKYENATNKLFKYILGLSKQELDGFRSQRIILQF